MRKKNKNKNVQNTSVTGVTYVLNKHGFSSRLLVLPLYLPYVLGWQVAAEGVREAPSCLL